MKQLSLEQVTQGDLNGPLRYSVHTGKENNDIWKREQGNLRVHHLANAGCVLNILRDSQHPFSKCVNINSVDIVDGKFDNVHMVTQFCIILTPRLR